MRHIYSDGSSLGNPGPGGWGVYVEDEDIKLYGYGGIVTNNQMELKAAIVAAKLCKKEESCIIYTDSEYVIKGITEWMKGWKSRGWKTAKKEPVKNQELWIELDTFVQDKNITWQWVRGHNGNKGNEITDQLAKKGANGESNEHLLTEYITGSKNKKEVKKENKEIKIMDTVDFNKKSYVVLKQIKDENNEDGFLLFSGQDWVFVKKESLLNSCEVSEQEKFNKLEKAKEDIKGIYYSYKKSCKHEIKENKYEDGSCCHCGESFGWYCKDSPDHVCHYYSSNGQIELINGEFVATPDDHNDKYETDDSCIFCGNPEERK